MNTEVDNIVDENGLLDISSQQVGQSTGIWKLQVLEANVP